MGLHYGFTIVLHYMRNNRPIFLPASTLVDFAIVGSVMGVCALRLPSGYRVSTDTQFPCHESYITLL